MRPLKEMRAAAENKIFLLYDIGQIYCYPHIAVVCDIFVWPHFIFIKNMKSKGETAKNIRNSKETAHISPFFNKGGAYGATVFDDRPILGRWNESEFSTVFDI